MIIQLLRKIEQKAGELETWPPIQSVMSPVDTAIATQLLAWSSAPQYSPIITPVWQTPENDRIVNVSSVSFSNSRSAIDTHDFGFGNSTRITPMATRSFPIAYMSSCSFS